MREAGKGDKRRPEDADAFRNNFDNIFRKKNKEQEAIQVIQQLEKERYEPSKTSGKVSG